MWNHRHAGTRGYNRPPLRQGDGGVVYLEVHLVEPKIIRDLLQGKQRIECSDVAHAFRTDLRQEAIVSKVSEAGTSETKNAKGTRKGVGDNTDFVSQSPSPVARPLLPNTPPQCVGGRSSASALHLKTMLIAPTY